MSETKTNASGGGGPNFWTTASSGQGVPPVQPVPKKERRTEAVRVRLTPIERDALNATAKAAGVGPCTYARVVVVTAVGETPTPAPRRLRKPNAAARHLAKWIGELGRVGNNLNQLARNANAGFDVDPAVVAEARDELRRLREAILALRDGEAKSP